MNTDAAVSLELIKLDSVSSHPDNPRVVIREDVVGAIVASMGDEYPQQHAIHVRPFESGYQIISGHQRTESARRKGLTHIWAWVEDLADDEAFMELVTANNQGELSPLEIGIHALKAVPKAAGGRGKKGGLAEYAAKVGKSKQYIQQIRDAAEVLIKAKPSSQLDGFLDKSQHLFAIHGLPEECWENACAWLAKSIASVSDINAAVKEAKSYHDSYSVPEEWQEYIPLSECTYKVFSGTNPASLQRLLDLAVSVHESLPEDLASKWKSWLIESAESHDLQRVREKQIELEEIAWERENNGERTVAEVIMADPPWRYDFSETDSRQIENQYATATVEEICGHVDLAWFPEIAEDAVLFLWATAPKLKEGIQVLEEWGFEYKTHAIWDKEKIGMGYWFRGQHELLLVGTRGSMSPPEASNRVSSVFREARGKHSKKPECVYSAIEGMFPTAVKAEIYQRDRREGWEGYGNESK